MRLRGATREGLAMGAGAMAPIFIIRGAARHITGRDPAIAKFIADIFHGLMISSVSISVLFAARYREKTGDRTIHLVFTSTNSLKREFPRDFFRYLARPACCKENCTAEQ